MRTVPEVALRSPATMRNSVGLPGAVEPDEREELAFDRKVDALQGLDFLELPGDAQDLDHGPTLTLTSAGCPGTSGVFHPASRSTFAA